LFWGININNIWFIGFEWILIDYKWFINYESFKSNWYDLLVLSHFKLILNDDCIWGININNIWFIGFKWFLIDYKWFINYESFKSILYDLLVLSHFKLILNDDCFWGININYKWFIGFK
jgi:hypothetical protein